MFLLATRGWDGRLPLSTIYIASMFVHLFLLNSMHSGFGLAVGITLVFVTGLATFYFARRYPNVVFFSRSSRSAFSPKPPKTRKTLFLLKLFSAGIAFLIAWNNTISGFWPSVESTIIFTTALLLLCDCVFQISTNPKNHSLSSS